MRNSSAWHDEITASLVKKVDFSMVEPFTHLILSLKTGVVPSDLKVAKVMQLFKSGDCSILTNIVQYLFYPFFLKFLRN